jgi:hypothetical protein
MLCARSYDFINQTGVKFPAEAGGQSGQVEGWDILRPNRRAEELVAEHLEALMAVAGEAGATVRR